MRDGCCWLKSERGENEGGINVRKTNAFNLGNASKMSGGKNVEMLSVDGACVALELRRATGPQGRQCPAASFRPSVSWRARGALAVLTGSLSPGLVGKKNIPGNKTQSSATLLDLKIVHVYGITIN